jgi:hypothetical protein
MDLGDNYAGALHADWEDKSAIWQQRAERGRTRAERSLRDAQRFETANAQTCKAI